MPEKPSKKKPEIPQPRPDIVLPDDNEIAGFGAHTVPRSPSPRSEVYQQAFLGRCPDHEEQ